MRSRWYLVGLFVLVAGGLARADYYSHPELVPGTRCAAIPAAIGDPLDQGGEDSIHCQRLFWDLPPVLEVGKVAVAAPFAEDLQPRFPRGLTDRIPPMWRGDVDGDGTFDEGFEFLKGPEGTDPAKGCEGNAVTCERLCDDPLMVPYWKERLINGQPETGTGDFNLHSADDPSEPLTGPLFEVACQYGSRSYYGPWQTAATVDPQACADFLADPDNQGREVIDGPCGNGVFDRIASTQAIRFESTARLDAFQAMQPGSPRAEWNIGSEYYNHYGSHHGTCSAPNHPCADPGSNYPKEEFEEGGECWDGYSSASHGAHERSDGTTTGCYAGDTDPRCTGEDRPPMSGFRNATQIPGRLSVPLPDGRGVLGGEDQIWGCNHHVVTQLPPGSYGVTERFINYRLQTGGVTNDANEPVWNTAAGAVFGGAVGEMIIQYFVKPSWEDVKPLNISFNALADAATTYYPPFTWNYHESEWFPPFDTQLALNAIHSHHRMVKGTMNVAPVNPPRPNAHDPNCGAPRPDNPMEPPHLYTSWEWEDAPVCQYWKEQDGPVSMRKGQSLRTTCYVNNGVTPEAIKHGLVAGATVETLRALGAPIPDYPAMGEASDWGDLLAASPIGKELLYGTHPPINYRVVYKCSNLPVDAPGATLVVAPANAGRLYNICPANPAVDADGDYIDGGYENMEQCGRDTDGDMVADTPGLCQPGSIIFACIGEDEMCIGVSMYWATPRLLSEDGDDEAMANLTSGDPDDLNRVGLPGNLGTETDVSGICTECDGGPGL